MTTHEFLSRFSSSHPTGERCWQTRCPAHDDRKPSLSITEADDGRTLLHCHAGCSPESIVAAVGVKLADLFPTKPHHNGATKKIVATYDYHNEHRNLVFQVVRYSPKDFRQRRPNPDKRGEWLWKMNGVNRVLFRLPDVLRDIKRGLPIFVCEGEKDVLAMTQRGFTATCNAGGAVGKAGDRKWQENYTNTLAGADVIMIADKDTAGRTHAQVVAGELHGKAKRIRIIELPDVNGKPVKDAADFFDAGGTAEQVTQLADASPCWTPMQTEPIVPLTPSTWFAQKYPSLADEFGEAVLESTDDEGCVSARDIGEDFLAATLGENGSPNAPTIFLPAEEKFYSYSVTDGIFSHQRDATLLTLLSRLLLECARACGDCDTKSLLFRFRDAANLSGVLRKARGLLEAPDEFFTSNLTEFIPCSNGMLRLEDNTLLPFSPSYRRRNKLAVPYNPNATCPLFLDTLMRPALEPDDLELLQRACGLALVGENLAQKILILTGTAGGGKGTFVRVLTGIIGQSNLASLRPQLLADRFELGRFLGKTLLYGADVPADFLNQRGASVLKSLTGSDPVTLELKNSNERPSMICRFNVMITCNSRLTVRLEGDIEAWRRRLVIVDYHRPKSATPIADLDIQILQKEGPGVLNWMLEGLANLRREGWQLKLNSKQQGEVDNLLLESDGVAVFARENLSREPNENLTLPDCYAAYVDFCTARGWLALSRNKFTAEVKDKVVRQFGLTTRNDISDNRGKHQIGWKGLTLQTFTEPSEKEVSELSEPTFTDSADTFAELQTGKTSAENALEL
jgi:P4 family phage/plasmid primase-like protien